MDPNRDNELAYVAPGSVSSGAMRLPGSTSTGEPSAWRDPDEHLVQPETRQEYFRGTRMEASPARPGHGDTHCQLDALIRLCVASDHIASSDLLTRRSERSDFATDTSVRKSGLNPETETRYLEELSFEVFHTQSRGHASERAREVVGTGVRRMFGVFVEPGTQEREAAGKSLVTVEEWLPELGWVALDAASFIDDPCLATPLPVASLMDAAAFDDAAARILVAKRNPVLTELEQRNLEQGKDEGFRDGLAQGKDEGFRDGKRTAVLAILAHRGIALSPSQQARIDACNDLTVLDKWLTLALSIESAGQLFIQSKE